MKYKASFADFSYGGKQTITLLRTDGSTVDILTAEKQEDHTYDPIIKTVTLSYSSNFDDFKNHLPLKPKFFQTARQFRAEHCPSIYVGRPELYDEKDIEHPLYTDIMSLVSFSFLPNCMQFYLFNRPIINYGGLNGLCKNICITDFSTDECAKIDQLFDRAANL